LRNPTLWAEYDAKKVKGYEAHPTLYIFPWKWSIEG
jgi:hypothetical protein